MKEAILENTESKLNTVTNYPIVLVHGIAVKDIAFFRAFGRIQKKLRQAGYKVFTANTDGFGAIETNAEQLKVFIENILKTENAQKVNIIAHSKGGLDSKYMIENLDMESSVASFTTLCTPHKGSPVATGILRFPKPLLKFMAFWINLWYRICGDKHPNALKVCDQLKLHDYEEITELPKGIYCQSYSATLKKSRDDILMGIPLYISKRMEKEKPSDGLVSVESSEYGEYRGNVSEESLSHSDIIDFSPSKYKQELVYDFYISLCNELAEMGF